MAGKKSGSKKKVPLFEFKESEKGFLHNEVYFRGKKLNGHFSKHHDHITECRFDGVDPSVLFDFDASDLPDNITFDIKTSARLTPHASDLLLMTRHGMEIKLLLECGFFHEQRLRVNLNPIKLVIEASKEAGKKGHKPNVSVNDFADIFTFSYYVIFPAKGNLLHHYKRMLTEAEEFVDRATKRMAKEVLKGKY